MFNCGVRRRGGVERGGVEAASNNTVKKNNQEEVFNTMESVMFTRSCCGLVTLATVVYFSGNRVIHYEQTNSQHNTIINRSSSASWEAQPRSAPSLPPSSPPPPPKPLRLPTRLLLPPASSSSRTLRPPTTNRRSSLPRGSHHHLVPPAFRGEGVAPPWCFCRSFRPRSPRCSCSRRSPSRHPSEPPSIPGRPSRLILQCRFLPRAGAVIRSQR